MSTKKAILWGGVIGFFYPIGIIALMSVLLAFFGTYAMLDGFVWPLRFISNVANPIIYSRCATADYDLVCKFYTEMVVVSIVTLLLGMLIGWLATIVARYGKKRPTS